MKIEPRRGSINVAQSGGTHTNPRRGFTTSRHPSIPHSPSPFLPKAINNLNHGFT